MAPTSTRRRPPGVGASWRDIGRAQGLVALGASLWIVSAVHTSKSGAASTSNTECSQRKMPFCRLTGALMLICVCAPSPGL